MWPSSWGARDAQDFQTGEAGFSQPDGLERDH